MKKNLFIVLVMLFAVTNANAQFGKLLNKAKNAAKSAVVDKAKDAKNSVKEQTGSNVKTTASSAVSSVSGNTEGVEGNEMTSWSYAKDISWDDITDQTSAQDVMAAAINQIKKEKKYWKDMDKTEIFKYHNSADYFLNIIQNHPRTQEGKGDEDKKIFKQIEEAKKYWIDMRNKEGWNQQMNLAKLQPSPKTDQSKPATYYDWFNWILDKADAADNQMEKIFDIHQALAYYQMCSQWYDWFAATNNSAEYKSFKARIDKTLTETLDAQKEYGTILDFPGDPASLRAEFKAFEVQYNKQKAEEAKKAAAHYKEFMLSRKHGSNPAIEKLANQIYSKFCADGSKAVYTVSMNADYAYDRTALGLIIDRYWTVLSVFKMPDGKYRMQNFSIKWMYNGGKYSSTPEMRGIGVLTVNPVPWVE